MRTTSSSVRCRPMLTYSFFFFAWIAQTGRSLAIAGPGSVLIAYFLYSLVCWGELF